MGYLLRSDGDFEIGKKNGRKRRMDVIPWVYILNPYLKGENICG